MSEYLLELNNISKAFPGVQALDDVTLKVRPGTVHALIGENGAGKSTLMKCLFGIYNEDAGEIYLDGQKVAFKDSKDALEQGVAMVHQELNQALKRNVMDNLWLGRYPKIGPFTSERKMLKMTREIFDGLGIQADPKQQMSEMPVSQRQMVEIAKAVSYDAKIIIFDEPTSSLTDVEVEHLFSIINDLKAKGCGIIYISHKLEEILSLTDEITVLRDGQYICTEPTSEMSMDRMISLMVGRELTSRYPDKTNVPKEVALEVRDLSAQYSHVKDVSFDVRSGEVLGVAGLDGSGRTELLENLFGIATRSGGEIFLDGKKIENRSALESTRNGFALLTEERRATGIFNILNIRENATISSLKKYRLKGFWLSNKKMKEATDWTIQSMRVKTPDQTTKIRDLSGGNQQKVILGRWLLTEPEVLLLDEPTRGIDVGAKYEIYQLINALAAEDKVVMMVSSEMPELLGVCDRILVMSGGRVAGIVDAKETDQEEIMRFAAMYA